VAAEDGKRINQDDPVIPEGKTPLLQWPVALTEETWPRLNRPGINLCCRGCDAAGIELYGNVITRKGNSAYHHIIKLLIVVPGQLPLPELSFKQVPHLMLIISHSNPDFPPRQASFSLPATRLSLSCPCKDCVHLPSGHQARHLSSHPTCGTDRAAHISALCGSGG